MEQYFSKWLVAFVEARSALGDLARAVRAATRALVRMPRSISAAPVEKNKALVWRYQQSTAGRKWALPSRRGVPDSL